MPEVQEHKVLLRFHLSGLMNRLFVMMAALSVLVAAYFLPRLFPLSQDITNLTDLGMQTCDPVRSPCKVLFENIEIQVYFPDGIDTMDPFTAEVIIDSFEVEQVNIKFFMHDMDMGVNRFTLDEISKSKWTGKVILPVCTLARSDWVAELELRTGNKVLQVNFGLE